MTNTLPENSYLHYSHFILSAVISSYQQLQ